MALTLVAAVLPFPAFARRAHVELMLRFVPRDDAVSATLALHLPDTTEIILIVGNDNRDAVPPGVDDRFGLLSRQRADAVVLGALDPAASEIRLLSLPRDLAIDSDRFGPLTLSEAFDYGGSAELATAVISLTGLPIHHYVEASFTTVVDVVNLLDGTPVDFCRRSRDKVTGFRAAIGPTVLDGEATLALIRSRAFEQLVEHTWTPIDQGDAGRIRRQQYVLHRLLPRLDGLGMRTQFRLALAAPSLIVLDRRFDGASVAAVHRILRDGTVGARTLPAEPIRNQADRISPFSPTHLGGRLYLQKAPGADDAIRWLERGADLPTSATPRTAFGEPHVIARAPNCL